MKKLFLVLAIAFLFTGCSPSKHAKEKPAAGKETTSQGATQVSKQVNFSDPVTWILGSFRVERLYRQPYSEWFLKGFDEYAYNPQVTDKLKTLMDAGITMKIVMGTWCPDSRREVPRFMRIIDATGFPTDRIEMIGVDNSKVAPVKDYEQLAIKRVPTFIVYKNNVEAGRIIENPVTSLEQDMVNILSRND
ncbi:MAG TPA: thioredoxin family protein [Bacteroidales bacterium]|nr:thioredoxin family protein [Bacteroidales bacterium]